MLICQCYLASGEICKNKSKPNSLYCGIHKNCKRTNKSPSPKRKSPSTKSKKCPEGTILNTDSNRCVNIDGKIGKKILEKQKKENGQSPRKSPSPKRKSPSPKRKSQSPKRKSPSPKSNSPSPKSNSPSPKLKCPKGKILNPDTGKCVDESGKIGRRILKNQEIEKKRYRYLPKKEFDINCPSKGRLPYRPVNRKEYFMQSIIFHPDKNPGCIKESNAKFARLNEMKSSMEERGFYQS
jgi:hypothetical protein